VNHELRMRVEHPPECPMCRGTESFPIGQLGRLAWFCCRFCGWQHSSPAVTECHEPHKREREPHRLEQKSKGTAC
jgi:hypothetical protein